MPDEKGYKSRFLPLPVDAYDLGIDLVLPRDALRLYEHVRRFVQRKDFKKGKAVEKRIYTDIRQTVLAKRIDHNRQWVNKTLGLLEELGWLKRADIPKDTSGQKRYFLGSRSEDHEETFWADKKLEEYRRSICKQRDVEFAKYTDLDWDDRVGLLKKLLKPVVGVRISTQKEVGVSCGEDRGVSCGEDRGVSCGEDRGCLAGKTGGVLRGRQGVSCGEDNLNKQELKNQDSKNQDSNRRVRDDEAVALAPASASGSGVSEPPAQEASAGEPPTDSDSDQNDQSFAAEPLTDEEYRVWLGREDADDDEELDVNEIEKRQAKAAEALKGAVDLHKSTAAVQEAKRNKLASDKQRTKNLAGSAIEKHTPKGSVKRMERVWLEAFDEHYPDFSPARWWIPSGDSKRPGKEAGLVSQLIRMYSVEDVEKYLKWAVASWGTIQTRFKDVPPVPTIGFLMGFRETLLPEAVMGNVRETVEAELRAWYAQHPNEDVPTELSVRVKALPGRG